MANNTILLKGDLGRRYEEARVRATKTIKPGMLIERYSDGTVQPHSGQNLGGELLVAIEDGLIGGTIDTDYAAGDLCRFISLAPGEEAQLILLDGAVATIGAPLGSNGDGKLKAATSGTDAMLVRALEALSPSGADARIKVVAGPYART